MPKQFTDKYGYVWIYNPSHAYPLSYIKRARLVMEEKLGRKLLPGEDVHHINQIKGDDRLENLMVMETGAHISLHTKETLRKRWGVTAESEKTPTKQEV